MRKSERQPGFNPLPEKGLLNLAEPRFAAITLQIFNPG